MTTQASRPKILSRAGDGLMRIVASSTPHPAIAVPGAHAHGQLLSVTDDFDGAAGGLGPNIRGKGFFKRLARREVSKLFARIQDTNLSCQMALFADAIASRAAQLGRIQDGPRHRLAKVLSG